MPPETTSETNFSFDPFLSPWAIVIAGILLLVISCGLAWRDSRLVERRWLVWVLLVFRCAAIAVLLWMLAGPTLVTTWRKFQKKQIAILVDTSASMGMVDALDGSGNVSRWAAAHGEGAGANQIRNIDSAAASLLAAKRRLEVFGKLSDSTKDGTAARASLAEAIDSIRAGVELVKNGIAALPANQSEHARGVAEAMAGIESGPLKVLDARSGEFKRGKSLAAIERKTWLPKQLEHLSAAIGQLQQAADEIAKASEGAGAAASRTSLAESLKRSRLDKVEQLMRAADEGWLGEIGKVANIARYEFGEKVVPANAANSKAGAAKSAKRDLATATQLDAALQQVAIDNTAHPLAAAILITDGAHNAGGDPRAVAPSVAGAALHIVPIGNTKLERDVILHHTHAPKVVLQNDNVVIESSVTAYDCAKEVLQVELLEGQTVIDRQTLNVAGEIFDTQVQMRWKAAKLGKHSLAVRVIPIAREETEENNRAVVDIQVMEETMRVLVADNFPRWETRYLLNLFKRDERVTFDQLLFEPQRSTGEGVRASFPGTLEEWSKYRVIILGDVLPSQFPAEQQKQLRDYVTELGGNLIIIAGKDAMPGAYLGGPLEPLLPVTRGDRTASTGDRIYLHVAEEAAQSLATQIAENPVASQVVWRGMGERTPIYSLSEFSKPKPTTHSLIWAGKNKAALDRTDSSTRSFLAWHYVGAGRVVYLAAPLTYQLRYRQGDTFHHRFWGQLLRWVTARDLAEGSQTARLSTDKIRYEIGEPVQATAQLRQLDGKMVTGASLQVEAWHKGKVLQNVALREDDRRPGTYHATLPELPPGPVRLQLLGARLNELLASERYTRPIETTVNIDPSGLLELRNTLCNMPLLREIAAASGGIVVPPTGLEAAFRQLDLKPSVSENISKQPVWNRWDLFWIFLGCLALEWAGRKYLNLS